MAPDLPTSERLDRSSGSSQSNVKTNRSDLQILVAGMRGGVNQVLLWRAVITWCLKNRAANQAVKNIGRKQPRLVLVAPLFAYVDVI